MYRLFILSLLLLLLIGEVGLATYVIKSFNLIESLSNDIIEINRLIGDK